MKPRISEEEKKRKENGMKIIEENRRRWEKTVEKEKKERESRSKQRENSKPKNQKPGTSEKGKETGKDSAGAGVVDHGNKSGIGAQKQRPPVVNKPIARAQSAQASGRSIGQKETGKTQESKTLDRKGQMNNYVEGLSQIDSEDDIKEEIVLTDDANDSPKRKKDPWDEDDANIGFKKGQRNLAHAERKSESAFPKEEVTGFRVANSFQVQSREKTKEELGSREEYPREKETKKEPFVGKGSYSEINAPKLKINGPKLVGKGPAIVTKPMGAPGERSTRPQETPAKPSNSSGSINKPTGDLNKQREAYGQIKKSVDPVFLKPNPLKFQETQSSGEMRLSFKEPFSPYADEDDANLEIIEDLQNQSSEESDANLLTEKEFQLAIHEHPMEVNPNAMRSQASIKNSLNNSSGMGIPISFFNQESSDRPGPVNEVNLEDEELNNQWKKSTKAVPYDDEIGTLKEENDDYEEDFEEDEDEKKNQNDDEEENDEFGEVNEPEKPLEDGLNVDEDAELEEKGRNSKIQIKRSFDYQDIVANALEKASEIKEFSESQKEKFRKAQNIKKSSGIGIGRHSEPFQETGHFGVKEDMEEFESIRINEDIEEEEVDDSSMIPTKGTPKHRNISDEMNQSNERSGKEDKTGVKRKEVFTFGKNEEQMSFKLPSFPDGKSQKNFRIGQTSQEKPAMKEAEKEKETECEYPKKQENLKSSSKWEAGEQQMAQSDDSKEFGQEECLEEEPEKDLNCQTAKFKSLKESQRAAFGDSGGGKNDVKRYQIENESSYLYQSNAPRLQSSLFGPKTNKNETVEPNELEMVMESDSMVASEKNGSTFLEEKQQRKLEKSIPSADEYGDRASLNLPNSSQGNEEEELGDEDRFSSQMINPIEEESQDPRSKERKQQEYPKDIFGFGVDSMIGDAVKEAKGQRGGIGKNNGPKTMDEFVDDFEFLPGGNAQDQDDEDEQEDQLQLSYACVDPWSKKKTKGNSEVTPSQGRTQERYGTANSATPKPLLPFDENKETESAFNLVTMVPNPKTPIEQNEQPKRASVNRGKWGNHQRTSSREHNESFDPYQIQSGLGMVQPTQNEETPMRPHKFDVLEIKNEVDESVYQRKMKKLETLSKKREKSKEALKNSQKERKGSENSTLNTSQSNSNLPSSNSSTRIKSYQSAGKPVEVSYKVGQGETPKNNFLEVQPYQPLSTGQRGKGTLQVQNQREQVPLFKPKVSPRNIKENSQMRMGTPVSKGSFSQISPKASNNKGTTVDPEKTAHFGFKSSFNGSAQPQQANRQKKDSSIANLNKDDLSSDENANAEEAKLSSQQFLKLPDDLANYEEEKEKQTQNARLSVTPSPSQPNQNSVMTPRMSEAKKPRISVGVFSHKSNKLVLKNSIKQVCLAGPVSQKDQAVVLKSIDDAVADHLVILFKGRHDFRALYKFDFETGSVTRLFFLGSTTPPESLNCSMIQEWFRYDSGAKEFKPIKGNKSFSKVVDAVSLKQPVVNPKRPSIHY